MAKAMGQVAVVSVQEKVEVQSAAVSVLTNGRTEVRQIHRVLEVQVAVGARVLLPAFTSLRVWLTFRASDPALKV